MATGRARFIGLGIPRCVKAIDCVFARSAGGEARPPAVLSARATVRGHKTVLPPSLATSETWMSSSQPQDEVPVVTTIPSSSVRSIPLQLSRRTTDASTNGSTDLSPRPAAPCSSLQLRLAVVAGSFSREPSVAGVPRGLLIPRSQVRSLPGPLRKAPAQGGFWVLNETAANPGDNQSDNGSSGRAAAASSRSASGASGFNVRNAGSRRSSRTV